ncbi:MAG: flagellar basal body P-ring protein FlgI [Phycisphaerae bacterium]|nr:flagellar basal body P-ring protein FlgI [Phycisphaerae bacterium]
MMKTQIYIKKYVYLTVTLFAIVLCVLQSEGYGKKPKNKREAQKAEVSQEVQLDKTIGDLAEIVAFNPIPVKGIGIVVGLAGTGSAECPPAVRDYLRQYILAQLGSKQLVNPDKMINSTDTAVVIVEGWIPAGAVKQQPFDISVKTMANTQTTSIKGGRLYTTELKYVSQVEEAFGAASKTLAFAAGDVYVDSLVEPKPDPRGGFVLGGGRAIQDTQILLAIYKPDFRTAATIRNRINERFGKNTANATSDSMISLSLPKKFNDNKERFIELIKSLYITSNAVSEDKQINSLIKKLETEPDKRAYETGLEAIGKQAADRVDRLMENSKDPQTKFVAARCLLNIGDDSSLKILRDIAQDSTSPFRLDAVKAIGNAAAKRDCLAIMNRIVGDDNPEVRYTAYKYLQKYDASSIIRILIGQDFYLDQVLQTSPKTVWVSRNKEQRIVLFGAPIDCEENIFIDSDDGKIIINSLPDENKISVMRKHPITGELMGPLKTSFRLADVIRILGDEPDPQDKKRRTGLGVSYSEIVELLKKMCDKGAVKAVFATSEPVSVMTQQIIRPVKPQTADLPEKPKVKTQQKTE